MCIRDRSMHQAASEPTVSACDVASCVVPRHLIEFVLDTESRLLNLLVHLHFFDFDEFSEACDVIPRRTVPRSVSLLKLRYSNRIVYGPFTCFQQSTATRLRCTHLLPFLASAETLTTYLSVLFSPIRYIRPIYAVLLVV